MQKLFSQKVRFKADDGSEFPKWKEKRLGDVFTERTERSKGGETLKSYNGEAENLAVSFLITLLVYTVYINLRLLNS